MGGDVARKFDNVGRGAGVGRWWFVVCECDDGLGLKVVVVCMRV
jgi:hypothetical protein